jgi:hypothetical protein
VGIEPVSRERAKQLGITVSIQPRPSESDVWVKVDFKATRALKGFTYAELELTKDGKRLVLTSLMPGKPANDSAAEDKRLGFYVDPTLLPEAKVTIVSYGGELGGSGYQLTMKDFLARAASR